QARRRSWDVIGPLPGEARMTEAIASTGDRAAFERLLGELRPKLHRYCARMTGSVIDGEDVLQEAVTKPWRRSRATKGSTSRRPGCSVSLTTKRWTSFAAAPGTMRSRRRRIVT